jgi:hypothetical protein
MGCTITTVTTITGGALDDIVGRLTRAWVAAMHEVNSLSNRDDRRAAVRRAHQGSRSVTGSLDGSA